MSELQFLLSKGFEVISSEHEKQYTFGLKVSNYEKVQSYYNELIGYQNPEVDYVYFTVREDLQEVHAYMGDTDEFYEFESINELLLLL